MSLEEERDPGGDLRLLILNTLEPNLDAHLTQAVAEGFASILGPDRVHVAQYGNACALFRQAAVQRRAAPGRLGDAARRSSGNCCG